MKKLVSILLGILLAAGCRRSAAPSPEDEPKTISVTNWTDRSELFVEFPSLVVGQTSRFAIHVTRLSDFKPVIAGRAEVLFRRGTQTIANFVAEKPLRPGIFAADVRVTEPGEYALTIALRTPGLEDRHELGAVRVYPDARATRAAAESPPGEETVTFLKEQQWTIDFATERVEERTLRESIRVPAEVEARTGGIAEVTVPFTGRLISSEPLPARGTRVSRGQVLAGLLPPTSSAADLPALELSRAEAQAALELARKDRARVERLVAEGALPQRRLDETRAVEATAEARFKAAQASIAHYEATRAAEGDPRGARSFLLRAPISGVISETHATTGANVESGENLFKIVDVSTVYVVGHLPESEAGRLRRLAGAELEMPAGTGSGSPQAGEDTLPLRRLVSIAQVLEEKSRTFPVIYEFDNRTGLVAVGQALTIRLFTSAASKRPAVPHSATVDDNGRPVVYVQTEGESFVRRPVRLGTREAGYVHIAEGIRAGERVVTRGANLIRLASLSGQVPAHGHVH